MENCVPLSSASPSFGPSTTGGEPGSGERLASRQTARRRERLADADHHRRHMGKRRKIARRADRALRRYDRDDVLRQHGFQQRQRRRPNAGCALREAGELQRHHQPRDRHRHRLADAGGMREHDVALQCLQVPAAMRTLASFPKPVLMP